MILHDPATRQDLGRQPAVSFVAGEIRPGLDFDPDFTGETKRKRFEP